MGFIASIDHRDGSTITDYMMLMRLSNAVY
jgi:hypothetical protein